MNKTVKKLINKTIELECNHVDDKGIESIIKNTDYEEWSQKYDVTRERLFDIVPKELHEQFDEVLNELETASNVMLSIEKGYMFKQGVIKGLTDLKYLNEDIGIEIGLI
ncbi:hypothetical protein [Haloimpatiens massiliensis]|uniref:hypothetical protein n=1 Tax=Haloimpatiens massiliensis TaxID=1658110 RepID=UPI000C84E9DA|nr:hypothetical protein [Haloimpatiens massiliensis]